MHTIRYVMFFDCFADIRADSALQLLGSFTAGYKHVYLIAYYNNTGYQGTKADKLPFLSKSLKVNRVSV